MAVAHRANTATASIQRCLFVHRSRRSTADARATASSSALHSRVRRDVAPPSNAFAALRTVTSLFDALQQDREDSFSSAIAREVEGDFVKVNPFSRSCPPKLIAVSPSTQSLLRLTDDEFTLGFSYFSPTDSLQVNSDEFSKFGSFQPQLGDGRSAIIAEIEVKSEEHSNLSAKMFEVQLKGSGRTPFSKMADGRLALSSAIKEFLFSEYFAALNVPTTHNLALFETGETIQREARTLEQANSSNNTTKEHKGALLCRVAPTFLRLGHFEGAKWRDDNSNNRSNGESALGGKENDDRPFDATKRFLHYFIARHHVDLLDIADEGERTHRCFLRVCTAVAATLAKWQSLGFVHGVLNSDNTSVLGLTLDYGPCAFVERYDPFFSPNVADLRKRYRLGMQIAMGLENCLWFGRTLSFYLSDFHLREGALFYNGAAEETFLNEMAKKFGVSAAREDPELREFIMQSLQMLSETSVGSDDWNALNENISTSSEERREDSFERSDETRQQFWLKVQEEESVKKELQLDLSDYTTFFLDLAALNPVEAEAKARGLSLRSSVRTFFQQYNSLLSKYNISPKERAEEMKRANPTIVPREAPLKRVIAAAEDGDYSLFRNYHSRLTRPFNAVKKGEEWMTERKRCEQQQ